MINLTVDLTHEALAALERLVEEIGPQCLERYLAVNHPSSEPLTAEAIDAKRVEFRAEIEAYLSKPVEYLIQDTGDLERDRSATKAAMGWPTVADVLKDFKPRHMKIKYVRRKGKQE